MDDTLGSVQVDNLKLNNSLVADQRNLDKLRKLGHGDKHDQAQALKAAAEQFEGLLMKYWVDGMRQSNDTLNPDSPLHSKYSSFFDDMLTQQHVQSAVSSTGGLNKNSITYMIAKQFSKSLGDEGKELLKELTEGSRINASSGVNIKGSYVKANQMAYRKPKNEVHNLYELYKDLPDPKTMRDFASQEDFVERMMPYAVRATEGTGFNPLVLVTQAALETGWGKHVPSNNNYYGIKANSSWTGESESYASDEFINGTFSKVVSGFRKYSDVLESMMDYIDFISTNPRYEKALDKSFDTDKYFEEIQRAGYATDPNYADKLKNISRKIAFMAYK